MQWTWGATHIVSIVKMGFWKFSHIIKDTKKEKEKPKMYMQFSFLFRIVENGMCDANEYVTAANLQQCKNKI